MFCNMSADDTVIICSDKVVQTACGMSNENMNKVGLWCEGNNIAINGKKSKHMIVGPHEEC